MLWPDYQPLFESMLVRAWYNTFSEPHHLFKRLKKRNSRFHCLREQKYFSLVFLFRYMIRAREENPFFYKLDFASARPKNRFGKYKRLRLLKDRRLELPMRFSSRNRPQFRDNNIEKFTSFNKTTYLSRKKGGFWQQ